ncbi:hypothetical protein C464_01716 [Halorubrum coriense DSM 10284]|uniref:Archaeal glycosylation protein B peripheral domain-containing protein n=1 Tax=Halorubrum coriense DSM 10284 TaxID=1227466 RepID=M0EWJ8_9EURY|nr:hypothetical protein [Halorubrum coriense]ELZ50799.1 hypothetical protein C464_01716 [Halorubrum coriense DSM 10284]
MPSPEDTTAATRAFLDDHPDAEESLAALVERDAQEEPWTFDEIELDSGRFGELVARDIAISVDGGYRLAHASAVESVLATSSDVHTGVSPSGSEQSRASQGSNTSNKVELDIRSRLIGRFVSDPSTTIALVGALATVAVARLVALLAVFRDGFVVSPANDTYFFRYWQERLAARAGGIFDFGLFADMGGAASARPLAHATNWWITVLLGGVDAAPIVAAWLPVLLSVCVGCLVYYITVVLTDDVRVALASVVFYGLAPANVVYTSVGFLDHQAHQYLWLGLLIATLTILGSDLTRRRATTDTTAAAQAHVRDPTMWAVGLGLALAVFASAHVWGGSPLTFIPVAAIIGIRVIVDVRHDVPPVAANLPLLAGLGLGAAGAFAVHHTLGWHESLAAITPVLVAGGGFVVVGIGAVWRRLTLGPAKLAVVNVIVAIGALTGYVLARPDVTSRIRTRVNDLFGRGGISETVSLFNPDFAVVLGPLLQLGLGFYFAIVVLAVITWAFTRRYEPGWLVLTCFAWYYILLATIQVRFAGQLAIVIAPFAGIGLIHLLSLVDLTRPVAVLSLSDDESRSSSRLTGAANRFNSGSLGSVSGSGDDPTPGSISITSIQLPAERGKRNYLVGAIIVVLLFNLVLVPSLVGQTTYDRAQFDAALTVDAHADKVNREYPQNFVLSQWTDNRMYNYFVNGESRSYGYARSTYSEFLSGSNPDDWYNRLQSRVGYVVITNEDRISVTNTTYAALQEGLGVGANGTNSVGRYQLIHAADTVRTYALVPGAQIQVTNVSTASVTATTTVTLRGVDYKYTRTATRSNGSVTLRVAHSGTYHIGNRTVRITENDVYAGNQTHVSVASQ